METIQLSRRSVPRSVYLAPAVSHSWQRGRGAGRESWPETKDRICWGGPEGGTEDTAEVQALSQHFGWFLLSCSWENWAACPLLKPKEGYPAQALCSWVEGTQILCLPGSPVADFTSVCITALKMLQWLFIPMCLVNRPFHLPSPWAGYLLGLRS